MSDISVKSLTKRFGDLVAVNEVDLDVASGEVVCLLGPSGCGKTTTLRMVAGLEDVTSGEVSLGGRRVNELAARDRNVAMVFQFYALYPSLTVSENIAYPLHAESLARAEIDQRVNRVAAMLELDGVLDRRPGQLAEGEKQRVAVARAIVRDPSCFLFDEPLSRLDVQLRETMRGQIKEVLAGLNRATVIVTHDQLEALTMADRIAVMRLGVIEQVATPHEIFAAPSNLFVAGFIGTPAMNLIPAVTAGSTGDAFGFALDGERIAAVADPAVATLGEGAAVTLGVRPRALELRSEQGDDTLTATADIIEPMGAETLVHLTRGEHELRLVVDRKTRIASGAQVHVRPKPGQMHVFDHTEQRVTS